VGRRQYRQPRRRWIAHLPVGSLGLCDSCRKLCLASRILQSQRRRDQIVLSGLYDLTASALRVPEKAYFGDDPARYAERSSIKGLAATKIPLMIVTAEFDAPVFLRQFGLLKEAACKGPNGCVRSVVLPRHNHMSEVYSINTADTRLTDQILDFVKTDK
jgi:hypothetical protein